ncbi:MAG: Holliday junction ATP-dependent DNA helicase RuvA [Candidatus Azambacteria bacterium GW2011_GWB2_46_37]|uniref:Holliday junction branch migration complex subunit RuvA n=3 Tax=Candidatus Azamiibacteriota TaxID=1752741 RepID=A0A0G1NQH3_9BACT|nr:MAG: Holliday junction ATP-dependent DNA helicase RuvA [Candidatus Azambacteria bacterium GW2011_GWC1_46_13]KKU38141.1 MAG: Holliday junction ATP-dependent DNA helicase RuvA [Candidatus Azambacteria bacterium GW2011_GWF2_46_32]KKU38984.1 MAG: Holliday junction ATP-dependent DNA helicase RuvA [Candidatus Azambacteria bacterium GW2011_GWB2_46_37]HAM95958.1 Holliday junction branch migration protein RuvA [Candidatus Azambacteria bacterium]HAQ05529.1 Holliday junction branch migration protein Ru
MISRLKGILETKAEKYVIMDIGGVGFKVFVSAATLENLPAAGQSATLHTHLNVREEALDLYGFLTQEELKFFELLLTISGVGPKVALGVLSIASVKTLVSAIAKGEVEFLTKVSGIGTKIAQKIILELKDKIVKLGFEAGEAATLEDYEVIDALIGLGYTPNQARRAVRDLPKDVKGVEKRIKEALKTLGK